MPLLTWNEELHVQHPRMDATHEEFVRHMTTIEQTLAACDGRGDAPPVLAAFDALIEHTVGHFDQEDRWMLATGFTADNCHSSQHRQVLGVLREVRRMASEGGKPEFIGQLLPELAQWFVQHAQAADNGLAGHLRDVGFDPETGRMSNPPEAVASSDCGAESCSH